MILCQPDACWRGSEYNVNVLLGIPTSHAMVHTFDSANIENVYFWRSMSWPKERWRAQRSAIAIAKCRYPWTNWILNAKSACKVLSASWPASLFRIECCCTSDGTAVSRRDMIPLVQSSRALSDKALTCQLVDEMVRKTSVLSECLKMLILSD